MCSFRLWGQPEHGHRGNSLLVGHKVLLDYFLKIVLVYVICGFNVV